MFRNAFTLLLAIALTACGAAQPTPDIDTIATDVAGTLQAAATATGAAASPTSPPIPTFTETSPPTPEPTTTPQPGRLNFTTGATQGVATGRVEANQTVTFTAGAAQNQVMVAELFTPSGSAVLEIVGADGTVLLPASNRWNTYRSVLRSTQDYEFRVIGGNSAQDFTLTVVFAVPVQFGSGASSATYSGRTVNGYPVSYGLHANQGQTLQVTVNTNASDAALTIWGFNDGTPYARAQNGVTNFSQSLPASQYYIIEVVPQGGRVIDFQVEIRVTN
ncbi:MAG: hypothetical protein KIS85_07250 [Anaerolineales bacterium]|nr:hypothetical protein [Anaerolineales bacterium]